MVICLFLSVALAHSLPNGYAIDSPQPVWMHTATGSDCSTLPWKIYNSSKWEWWITDASICNLYLQHQSDIDLFRPYPDAIITWLANNLGQTDQLPSKIKLTLISPGGAITANGEMGIPIDAFYNDYNGHHGGWAYVLIAHETMNLYTGSAVSAGWPTDWWADDKSPFPLVTGMKACMDINWQDSKATCQMHLNNYLDDPLVQMFQALYTSYGTSMFKIVFMDARSDGIDWTRIGSNPSPLLTNYVAAYLFIGAGTDLSPLMNGRVPNFNQSMTLDIKQVRMDLQSINRTDSRWTQYLSGDYASIHTPEFTIAPILMVLALISVLVMLKKRKASATVVWPIRFL